MFINFVDGSYGGFIDIFGLWLWLEIRLIEE